MPRPLDVVDQGDWLHPMDIADGELEAVVGMLSQRQNRQRPTCRPISSRIRVSGSCLISGFHVRHHVSRGFGRILRTDRSLAILTISLL